jgi:hypothetical protein
MARRPREAESESRSLRRLSVVHLGTLVERKPLQQEYLEN